jgi:hypothetical protein
MILVRFVAVRAGHEQLARDARQRIEHARIAHVAPADLLGNHARARDSRIRRHRPVDVTANGGRVSG